MKGDGKKKLLQVICAAQKRLFLIVIATDFLPIMEVRYYQLAIPRRL